MSGKLRILGTNGDACSTNRPSPLPTDLGNSLVHGVRRVQLFFPPMVFSKSQSRQTAMFPLGLGYIGAVLHKEGYDVSLVDCPSEGYDTLIDIGKDRFIYGLDAEAIRRKIQECRPDAIGISCLFSTLEKRLLEIGRIAKEVDSNIIVLCGGPHVSAFYDRLLRQPQIDYCVIGEGETAIEELFAAFNGRGDLAAVGSIGYRKSGNLVIQPRTQWIQNLDEVPYPGRHLVDMNTYFEIGKVQGLRMDGESRLRIAQMTTSRGCPFQCTYCGKDVTWGQSYRSHSAEYVLDEIEHLIDSYGIERIAFQDDNLTADMKRAAKIFDGMTERGLNVTWEAHNGLGVNFLSPELLEKMKASGCVSFTIAVESANDATLRRVKKPNYIKLAPPIVRKAAELGIEVRGFFMIGFPGETIEEVQRTVRYARELNLAVTSFALVTPLPGTVLYRECVQAGMIDEQTIDFEDFSFGAFDLQLSNVPVERLKAIRKVEWLKTVLMDENGHFRREIAMSPEDVMEELENGVRLFPAEHELRQLQQEAMDYYRHRKLTA